MSDFEELKGGNSKQVKRHSDTVIRQCGTWSPFVHQLLQYLEEKGFHESPRFLKTDGRSETLSFIEGEVGNDPLKPYMLDDTIVVEAAQLLRKFHDISQDFVVPTDAQFFQAIDSDNLPEVICHNDFAPYNLVFKHEHIIGIIDFDTAAPGTRIWDIAYTVYRFAPLVSDAHCIRLGWQSPPDRAQRLKIFCDAYGLGNRSKLINTVIQRLEKMIQYMRDTGSNLEHIPIYLEDIDYIKANHNFFQHAVNSTSDG